MHEENDIFYWSAERGTGEIDFLVPKYNMKYEARTSMSDYREQEWMVKTTEKD